MKYLIAFLFLTLTACAGGSGGSAPGGANPPSSGNVPETHEYRLRVIGAGIVYVGVLYNNFGESDQLETNISAHAISVAGYEDVTVFGRNAIVQGSMNSGASMTFELYMDGTLVDTQTTTQTGSTLVVREGI